MISMPIELSQDENPLETLDDVAQLRDGWKVTHVNETIAFLELPGDNQRYLIYLEWQEEFSSLQFETVMNLTILDAQKEMAANLLMQINNTTWVGHFNLSEDKQQPVFRHTLFLRHIPSVIGAEMIAQTVDAAIEECNRFFPTFKMLSKGDIRTQDILSATLMETAGEA